jgi:hypothetical protein
MKELKTNEINNNFRKESDHPDSHEEDKSGLPDCHQRFQLELQEDCKGLQSAAQKFQLISRDIDSVEQKVTALAELEIFSTSQVFIFISYYYFKNNKNQNGVNILLRKL